MSGRRARRDREHPETRSTTPACAGCQRALAFVGRYRNEPRWTDLDDELKLIMFVAQHEFPDGHFTEEDLVKVMGPGTNEMPDCLRSTLIVRAAAEQGMS